MSMVMRERTEPETHRNVRQKKKTNVRNEKDRITESANIKIK